MRAGSPPEAPPPRRNRRRDDAADNFRRLADFAPVMIWVADPDRNSVYFNRPWLDFTGRALDEELGRGWIEGIHPDDREGALAAFAAAYAALEPFETEYRLRRADGEYRWLIDKGVPLVDEGKLRGYVGSCLDVTDRVADRAAEDEKRAQVLERERAARANAETAALARDQFLAIVSHELRSPLNGIKSWTHVLESQLGDAEPTVKRALAGIMIGVEHQVRLIEDLLDVTRAMSGNLGLAKQSMPLVPVLADAVDGLRATALEKHLCLATDYGIADREIHGDPDRIRQIFVNLLANAVKFTRPGGHIWVSARHEGDMARVEVRDDGAGIPLDFLPYIFDPFRQADQGAHHRSRDGLGLALVRRLAELHGGHVSCESAGVGRGASFRVHLPLLRKTGPPRVLGDDNRAQRMSPFPSLSGIRVMLIDDQLEARESLAALLSQTGAEVVTAASGQEALAYFALEDGSGKPEVIVCDIAMPGEDGYATLKRIRKWESSRPAPARARRPAVALSAFTQREDRIRALSEGFQMHLTKPVVPAELILVISSVARGMQA